MAKKRGFALRFSLAPTYPAMFFMRCYVLAHYSPLNLLRSKVILLFFVGWPKYFEKI